MNIYVLKLQRLYASFEAQMAFHRDSDIEFAWYKGTLHGIKLAIVELLGSIGDK